MDGIFEPLTNLYKLKLRIKGASMMGNHFRNSHVEDLELYLESFTSDVHDIETLVQQYPACKKISIQLRTVGFSTQEKLQQIMQFISQQPKIKQFSLTMMKITFSDKSTVLNQDITFSHLTHFYLYKQYYSTSGGKVLDIFDRSTFPVLEIADLYLPDLQNQNQVDDINAFLTKILPNVRDLVFRPKLKFTYSNAFNSAFTNCPKLESFFLEIKTYQYYDAFDFELNIGGMEKLDKLHVSFFNVNPTIFFNNLNTAFQAPLKSISDLKISFEDTTTLPLESYPSYDNGRDQLIQAVQNLDYVRKIHLYYEDAKRHVSVEQLYFTYDKQKYIAIESNEVVEKQCPGFPVENCLSATKPMSCHDPQYRNSSDCSCLRIETPNPSNSSQNLCVAVQPAPPQNNTQNNTQNNNTQTNNTQTNNTSSQNNTNGGDEITPVDPSDPAYPEYIQKVLEKQKEKLNPLTTVNGKEVSDECKEAIDMLKNIEVRPEVTMDPVTFKLNIAYNYYDTTTNQQVQLPQNDCIDNHNQFQDPSDSQFQNSPQYNSQQNNNGDQDGQNNQNLEPYNPYEEFFKQFMPQNTNNQDPYQNQFGSENFDPHQNPYTNPHYNPFSNPYQQQQQQSTNGDSTNNDQNQNQQQQQQQQTKNNNNLPYFSYNPYDLSNPSNPFSPAYSPSSDPNNPFSASSPYYDPSHPMNKNGNINSDDMKKYTDPSHPDFDITDPENPYNPNSPYFNKDNPNNVLYNYKNPQYPYNPQNPQYDAKNDLFNPFNPQSPYYNPNNPNNQNYDINDNFNKYTNPLHPEYDPYDTNNPFNPFSPYFDPKNPNNVYYQTIFPKPNPNKIKPFPNFNPQLDINNPYNKKSPYYNPNLPQGDSSSPFDRNNKYINPHHPEFDITDPQNPFNHNSPHFNKQNPLNPVYNFNNVNYPYHPKNPSYDTRGDLNNPYNPQSPYYNPNNPNNQLYDINSPNNKFTNPSHPDYDPTDLNNPFNPLSPYYDPKNPNNVFYQNQEQQQQSQQNRSQDKLTPTTYQDPNNPFSPSSPYYNPSIPSQPTNNQYTNPDHPNFDIKDPQNPFNHNSPYFNKQNPLNPVYNFKNLAYPYHPRNPQYDASQDLNNPFNPSSPYYNPSNPQNQNYDPNTPFNPYTQPYHPNYDPHSLDNPFNPKSPYYNPENPNNIFYEQYYYPKKSNNTSYPNYTAHKDINNPFNPQSPYYDPSNPIIQNMNDPNNKYTNPDHPDFDITDPNNPFNKDSPLFNKNNPLNPFYNFYNYKYPYHPQNPQYDAENDLNNPFNPNSPYYDPQNPFNSLYDSNQPFNKYTNPEHPDYDPSSPNNPFNPESPFFNPQNPNNIYYQTIKNINNNGNQAQSKPVYPYENNNNGDSIQTPSVFPQYDPSDLTNIFNPKSPRYNLQQDLNNPYNPSSPFYNPFNPLNYLYNKDKNSFNNPYTNPDHPNYDPKSYNNPFNHESPFFNPKNPNNIYYNNNNLDYPYNPRNPNYDLENDHFNPFNPESPFYNPLNPLNVQYLKDPKSVLKYLNPDHPEYNPYDANNPFNPMSPFYASSNPNNIYYQQITPSTKNSDNAFESSYSNPFENGGTQSVEQNEDGNNNFYGMDIKDIPKKCVKLPNSYTYNCKFTTTISIHGMPSKVIEISFQVELKPKNGQSLDNITNIEDFLSSDNFSLNVAEVVTTSNEVPLPQTSRNGQNKLSGSIQYSYNQDEQVLEIITFAKNQTYSAHYTPELSAIQLIDSDSNTPINIRGYTKEIIQNKGMNQVSLKVPLAFSNSQINLKMGLKVSLISPFGSRRLLQEEEDSNSGNFFIEDSLEFNIINTKYLQALVQNKQDQQDDIEQQEKDILVAILIVSILIILSVVIFLVLQIYLKKQMGQKQLQVQKVDNNQNEINNNQQKIVESENDKSLSMSQSQQLSSANKPTFDNNSSNNLNNMANSKQNLVTVPHKRRQSSQNTLLVTPIKL